MPKIPVNLIRGDSHGSDTDYRDMLPINMYAVNRDILGASGYMLQWPGISKTADGEGSDRGAIYNERHKIQYRVSGNKLLSKDVSGNVEILGEIPGNDQVSMPYSFNTQAIIASGRMFLYDSQSGLREVSDTDLGDPIDGEWIDGYYLLTDGEFLYHTELSDEGSISPLSFATAEFMPDPSLGVEKTQDNKAVIFGRYTIEYFVNVAQTDFAFSRVETRAQKIGIVSTHAKTESEGSFYIVGGRRGESIGVHAVGLGRTEKLSTKEIDKIIEQYDEIELSDIRVESRVEKDDSFIIIHLPNEVLCYNLKVSKSDAWSILKSDRGRAPYSVINGVFDSNVGRWEYGDKLNGNIGRLDYSTPNQYGQLQEWELFTKFIKIERSSVNEIEIETIPGYSINNDARVAISITTDGVFYGTEVWCDYGAPLRYGDRFLKRRLGYVRDWIGFKLRGVSSSRMAFGLFTLDYT